MNAALHPVRALRSTTLLLGLMLAVISELAQADAPPVSAAQPVDQSVSVGATASLLASFSGTAPLIYQWLKDGEPLPNATNRSLVLTNIQLIQAGVYSLIATNPLGAATSHVAVVDVDGTFTKLISTSINVGGGASGAAAADFNRDGLLDLLIVAKGGGGTMIVTNSGKGTFAKWGVSGIGSDGLGSGIWADFDNDGYLDLFVAGANTLYRGQTNGTFKKQTFNAGGFSSYCASWADIDNDGFIDLFMGNYYNSGSSAFFRNNGDGTFTRVGTNLPSVDRGNSQGVSWGDYDNDGRLDLFIANTSGAKCGLYHNDGAGNFTKITNSPVVAKSGSYACGAWGDYDNDGYLDLFVCGYNQQHQLFHNNRDGTFSSVTNAGSITKDIGDDQTCAWADYDNDGWLDLFVCSGGPTRGMKDFLYHNNGDGTFTKIVRGSLVNDNGEGGAAVWADWNHDGFPDLFVSNFQNIGTGDKENYLYFNNGNSNHWLTVTCQGRVSNRSAIGAKVRIKTVSHGTEMWQMREISGGGAYVSQSSPEAAFGFGDATNALELRVEWPSGTIQTLTNVSANQFITLVEPPKLSATTIAGQLHLALRGGKGVTYQLESTVNLIDWSPAFEVSSTNQMSSITNPLNSELGQHFFRAHER